MTQKQIESAERDELVQECLRLRQGLWDCYGLAGGDQAGDKTPEALMSDIVWMVKDTVKELMVDYMFSLEEGLQGGGR